MLVRKLLIQKVLYVSRLLFFGNERFRYAGRIFQQNFQNIGARHDPYQLFVLQKSLSHRLGIGGGDAEVVGKSGSGGEKLGPAVLDRIDQDYQTEKMFVNNASHEINNPLTAIQGECEVALMRDRSHNEYKSSLKSISEETNRIINIMHELLLFSHTYKPQNKIILLTKTKRIN